MSSIKPASERFLYWLTPNWKAPKKCYRVEIAIPLKVAASYAISAIQHILRTPSIKTAYTREEIDEVFNNEVLKKYGRGRYYSTNGNPKETMNKVENWLDLLNNKLSIVIQNIAFLENCEINGVIPENIIEDVIPDIQAGLRDLKIIEDWIHYHRDFMQNILVLAEQKID